MESGLIVPTHEALSLAEVLGKVKEKHAMPNEALEAAEQLGYLIEANWYGGDATDEEQQEAEKFAETLYEKLSPLLDSYGQK